MITLPISLPFLQREAEGKVWWCSDREYEFRFNRYCRLCAETWTLDAFIWGLRCCLNYRHKVFFISIFFLWSGVCTLSDDSSPPPPPSPSSYSSNPLQSQIGGKGSVRRKVLAAPKADGLDDKKLANGIKKLDAQPIPTVEDVSIIMDNQTVMQFNSPKGAF